MSVRILLFKLFNTSVKKKILILLLLILIADTHAHTHMTMLQLSFLLIAVKMYYGIAKFLEVSTFLPVMLYSIIIPPIPSCNKSETIY